MSYKNTHKVNTFDLFEQRHTPTSLPMEHSTKCKVVKPMSQPMHHQKTKNVIFFKLEEIFLQCSLQIVQDLLIFIRNIPNVPNIS